MDIDETNEINLSTRTEKKSNKILSPLHIVQPVKSTSQLHCNIMAAL